MITGNNRVVEHDGRQYHLQVEDLGDASQQFEIRVYDGGTVLWQKRVSYDDVVEPDMSRPALEHAVRAKMDKMLLTVEAGIQKGKIG
ncbi:MAG: hypothetical protein AAGC60_15085 [Acidobacteriota bacterium]